MTREIHITLALSTYGRRGQLIQLAGGGPSLRNETYVALILLYHFYLPLLPTDLTSL